MFLSLLERRNPAFLQAAAELHRSGAIPPNSYVLDLDAIERNARAFASEAERLGLKAFAMTKQIGRNPDASAAIRRGGITHAVGVDLQCALAAAAGGLAAGHVGHLVQIPRHETDTAIALRPLFWTVFSEEKAHEAAAAARRAGVVQDVLVRLSAPGDRFYRGHEGGFPAGDVVAVADMIDAIEGLRFAGVTSFPATLFDAESGTARSTPNLATLSRAKEALLAAGREHVELNAPGTTSVAILETLAAAGATQVEPGHGLTGTTPLHAVADLVEEPAVAYVTEVSHLVDGSAFVFGGGLYADPVLAGVGTDALLVGADGDVSAATRRRVEMPAADAIDYYAAIPLEGTPVASGDTVLMGFRPQAFVTRALTVGIRGISSGAPQVAGVWAADGSAPLGLDQIEGAR